jgi:hypothetical protein
MRLFASVALAALVAGCTAQQQGSRAAPETFQVLASPDRCVALTPSQLGATRAKASR